jgi:hypothetical protein
MKIHAALAVEIAILRKCWYVIFHSSKSHPECASLCQVIYDMIYIANLHLLCFI